MKKDITELYVFIDDFCKIYEKYEQHKLINKVFKGLAKSGKSSMGFFYGFKLHVVINDKGEFMALQND